MLETELPEIALFLQDVEKITAKIETVGWGGKAGEGWGRKEANELSWRRQGSCERHLIKVPFVGRLQEVEAALAHVSTVLN